MSLFSILNPRKTADALPPPVSEAILSWLSRMNIQGERGFYVECGANDGVTQSNTIRLERLGWHGLLIEPSPTAFEKCLNNRNNRSNLFENCALVANDEVQTLQGDFSGHLMSSVGGTRRNRPATTEVRARTLQSILTQHNIINVDFFSLDVEGYEMEAVKGIDFTKTRIQAIMIEVYSHIKDKIDQHLSDNGYRPGVNISNFSKKTHPSWDGTHNDFLYILKDSPIADL